MSNRFIQIDPSHYTRVNKLSEDLRTIYCYLAEHCNTQNNYEVTLWINPKTKKGGYKVNLKKGQFSTNGTNIAKLIGSTSDMTGMRKLKDLERAGLIQLHINKRVKGQPYQGHTIVTVCGIIGSPFDAKRYQEVQNQIKNEVKKIPTHQKQASGDGLNDGLSISRYNQEEADQKDSAILPIASRKENSGTPAMCDGIAGNDLSTDPLWGPNLNVVDETKSHVSKYTLAGKEKELYDVLYNKTHVHEYKSWSESYKEKIPRAVPEIYSLVGKFYKDGEIVINPTKIKKTLNLTDIAEAEAIISALICKRYIHVIEEKSKPGEYQLIYVNTPEDMEVLKAQEELSSRIIDGKITVLRTETGPIEKLIREVEETVTNFSISLKLQPKVFHIKRIADDSLFSDFNDLEDIKINRRVLEYVDVYPSR